jgi:pyruvate dehydrogenase complex dehydrogenase (E1) component
MNLHHVSMCLIAVVDQPACPDSHAMEKRITSITRWNAQAMVVRANKRRTVLRGSTQIIVRRRRNAR